EMKRSTLHPPSSARSISQFKDTREPASLPKTVMTHATDGALRCRHLTTRDSPPRGQNVTARCGATHLDRRIPGLYTADDGARSNSSACSVTGRGADKNALRRFRRD